MTIKHGDRARNVMCDEVLKLIDEGTTETYAYLRIIAAGTDYDTKRYFSGDETSVSGEDSAVEPGAGTWAATDIIAQLAFGIDTLDPNATPTTTATAFMGAGVRDGDQGDENAKVGKIGKAYAHPVAPDSDCNEGTATHFQIVNKDGDMIISGNVSLTGEGGDIQLTSTGINDGDTIAIRNLSYTCAP